MVKKNLNQGGLILFEERVKVKKIMNKEIVQQLWKYIVKPELLKRAKSTSSRIDDFIVKQMDMAINEYLKEKPAK